LSIFQSEAVYEVEGNSHPQGHHRGYPIASPSVQCGFLSIHVIDIYVNYAYCISMDQSPKQYVEAFHLLFLDQLSRKLDQSLYVLKGGCNLRFFFKSIRYSEDIDIDVQIIAQETLRNKIRNILNTAPFNQALSVRKLSIDSITEPKQTQTTQRWKIFLKIDNSPIVLNTKIEFSRRGITQEAQFETIDKELIRQYRLTPFFVNHYSAESAFCQKIAALILRTQTQARDIFDLYLLRHFIKEIKIPKELVQELHTAIERIHSINFEDFKSQVLAYLATEHQQEYDSVEAWESIQLDVINILEHYQHVID